jgi:hypothetical protein
MPHAGTRRANGAGPPAAIGQVHPGECLVQKVKDTLRHLQSRA